MWRKEDRVSNPPRRLYPRRGADAGVGAGVGAEIGAEVGAGAEVEVDVDVVSIAVVVKVVEVVAAPVFVEGCDTLASDEGDNPLTEAVAAIFVVSIAAVVAPFAKEISTSGVFVAPKIPLNVCPDDDAEVATELDNKALNRALWSYSTVVESRLLGFFIGLEVVSDVDDDADDALSTNPPMTDVPS